MSESEIANSPWDRDEMLLSVKDCAKIMGCSVSLVRHLLVRDAIPGFGRIGRSRRISVRALRAYIAGGIPNKGPST